MLYKKLYRSRKSVLLSLFVLLVPNALLPMQSFSGGGASGANVSSVRQDSIDKVWADAPASVKIWADELQRQDESICDKPYRLFLYGVPGTGKTTLARGIAKKNPDWVVEPIDASDCGSRYRGATASNLKRKLKKALEKQKQERVKMIVIIDEAHTLLEKYGEEGSDSGRTSEVLRAFLDKQIEDDNKDLMIILTGNEVSDIKPSLRSRLQAYGIKILAPSPSKLYEIFNYYTESYSFEELDEENIYHIFEVGNIKVPRDVVDFVKKLKRTISETGYRGPLNQYSVTFDFLEKVAQSFKASNRDFGGDEPHVSQRAFQQKLQRETQEENRKLHKEAQEHAEKLSEKNTAHAEKLSNRSNAIQIGLPVATFAAGYALKKYRDSQEADTSVIPDAPQPTSTTTNNVPITGQAQSTGQSCGSSNIASVVKTFGAGAAATVVVKGVATGTGVATTGGSVGTAVANVGTAAKAIGFIKLVGLAMCANPLFALIVWCVGVLLCCPNKKRNKDHKED